MIRKNILLNILAWGLAIFLGGCASPSVEGPEVELPVFPPPPEEARFKYERSLISSADIEIESSDSVFERFVTGARRTGIGLGKPFGVTVHQGRVFVSDTLQRMVLAFDVRQGKFIEIGVDKPGELVKPLGLDVDLQGNLYVCDSTLKEILVFDRDGNYQRRFGGPELFDRPSGLTVDPEGQRVYVVDTGGIDSQRHQVTVFDALSGEKLHTIAERGSGDGQLNLPREAVLNQDGNLYVVDGGNFRVQVFSPDGEFIRSIGSVGRMGGQFSRPKGIGSDPEGNIYVADTAFGNFQIFTADGQLLLAVGSRNARPGPANFMLPSGLAVDEDGRVYMVDQYFRKVDVFRPAALEPDQGWLVYRAAEKK